MRKLCTLASNSWPSAGPEGTHFSVLRNIRNHHFTSYHHTQWNGKLNKKCCCCYIGSFRSFFNVNFWCERVFQKWAIQWIHFWTVKSQCDVIYLRKFSKYASEAFILSLTYVPCLSLVTKKSACLLILIKKTVSQMKVGVLSVPRSRINASLYWGLRQIEIERCNIEIDFHWTFSCACF